jgi:hypothetical protein
MKGITSDQATITAFHIPFNALFTINPQFDGTASTTDSTFKKIINK